MGTCRQCGQINSDGAAFCKTCGAALSGGEAPQNPGMGAQPSGFNQAPNQYMPNNGYGQPIYQQVQMGKSPDKSAVGQIVFAIINIVLGGNIFAIIALVFAIMANGATTDAEFDSKKKTAKILNIISLVMVIIIWIALIAMIIASIGYGDYRYSYYSGGYY